MYFPKRKEDLVIGYFFYNNKKLTYKNVFHRKTINNFPVYSKIEFETLLYIYIYESVSNSIFLSLTLLNNYKGKI